MHMVHKEFGFPGLMVSALLLTMNACGDGSSGAVASQVTATPQVATTTLPAGSVMLGYKKVVRAGGGSNTGYVWTVSNGALPPGVTLVSGTPDALLHGLPTATGSFNFTLRVVDSSGQVGTQALTLQINQPMIQTVAGTGLAGLSGDGGAATAAQLDTPAGIASDSAGNIVVVDRNNHRGRRIDPLTGVISTVAGTTGGFNGDGQTAALTQFNLPSGLAFDAAGNGWVADQNNHRLRRVASGTTIVSTVAGTGTAGFSGDGAAATAAQLNAPSGVAIDRAGNVFIADSFNHRVRRIDALTGIITTVAGDGTASYGGDGGSATSAQLFFPLDVAVDEGGNLLIADSFNNCVRRVNTLTGVISTVAGNGVAGYTGDGASALLAQLDFPVGVALDADQNILIADGNNHAVRLVDRTTGNISTLTGTGVAGYNGDNQPAGTAQIDSPYRLTVDSSGAVLLTEAGGMRVRRIGQ